MNKKTVAILLELIPVVSAIISLILLKSPNDSEIIRNTIAVTFLLAFLGVPIFFIGRKLGNGDRLVQILGIMDCLAALCIIGTYILAIFNFGL